jgi:hypothetical protein
MSRKEQAVNAKRQPGDPLPRPQQERLDLPEEQHMEFWHLVIREFDWTASRVQSKLLYYNKAKAPHEGEAPA